MEIQCFTRENIPTLPYGAVQYNFPSGKNLIVEVSTEESTICYKYNENYEPQLITRAEICNMFIENGVTEEQIPKMFKPLVESGYIWSLLKSVGLVKEN